MQYIYIYIYIRILYGLKKLYKKEKTSRERLRDSVMWHFGRVIFHLALHLNFFTYFGL